MKQKQILILPGQLLPAFRKWNVCGRNIFIGSIPMLNPDFKELLRLFNDNHIEYQLVGGYAMAAHGYPRYTGAQTVYRTALTLKSFGKRYYRQEPTPGTVRLYSGQFSIEHAATPQGSRYTLIHLPPLSGKQDQRLYR